MAAVGRACDLKLGRERRAAHRPVCCKRAQVIKVSARDISRAGDPPWALASAFSLWLAAAGEAVPDASFLAGGDPGGGVAVLPHPPPHTHTALCWGGGWWPAPCPGSYTSEISLTITPGAGDLGLRPAWEFWSCHSLDGGISSKLFNASLSVPSSVIIIYTE